MTHRPPWLALLVGVMLETRGVQGQCEVGDIAACQLYGLFRDRSYGAE